jgi:beta-xylosidase
MGLLREDGSAKPALEAYGEVAGEMGLCQWFHYQDHRLDDAVAWMKRLGVRYLRTGLAGPTASARRDRLVRPADGALADFDVTVTFCFTPEH